MYITDNKLPSQQLVSNIIATVSQNLASNLHKMFKEDHQEHHFLLLKNIIFCYCKIRLHNLARRFTESQRGELVRKTYAKLILFKHQ